MNSKENYKKLKKRLLELFYISVENDIEKWDFTDIYRENVLQSPIYSSELYPSYYLYVNIQEKKLILNGKSSNFDIATFGIFKNTKIKRYIKKIKEHIKYENTIKEFTEVIRIMEALYIKSIRKEKLEQIINNE